MFKIVEFSHYLIDEYQKKHPNESLNILDATCGNGLDTLYLALKFPTSIIDACDIQKLAITKTLEKLQEHQINNVNLYHTSFTEMTKKSYNLVIFNLGYLPNGDKTITTKAEETLKAINNILNNFDKVLDPLVIISLYPGHQEGCKEAKLIDSFLYNLNSKEYLVCKYLNYNRTTSPFILTISKNKLKNV